MGIIQTKYEEERKQPIQEDSDSAQKQITKGTNIIQEGAQVASWTFTQAFINQANFPVYKGNQQQKCTSQCQQKDIFYCGRKLGVDKIPDSNGTCGPCCGPSCDDCKNCRKKDEIYDSRGINVVGFNKDSQSQEFYGQFQITDDQGKKALEEGKIGIEVKIPITLTTIRITCSSAKYLDDNEDYAGMIVYDIGTFDAKGRTGQNIKPGWVLIVNSKDLKDVETPGGDGTMIHGKLVYHYFKENYMDLAKKYGVVYGGFAICKGVYKFNSSGLNGQHVKDKYHDGQREMHPDEARLVEGAIRLAKKQSSFNAQTIQVGSILHFWHQREKELDDKVSRTDLEQKELDALQSERKARESNQEKLKKVTKTQQKPINE